MNYFLCSKEVINTFPEVERSKPFKSGYEFESDDEYYVALLDFDEVEKYYNDNYIDDDFWCRECVPGQIDVSKITIKAAKRNGLFVEIGNILNLSTGRNQAMIIYNLSKKYNCNPIEFINKIA